MAIVRRPFPPLHGGNAKPLKVVDNATITTGKGGIKSSLRVKKAGTRPSPGVEKTNAAS
jgi:hypothetical protein